MREPPIPENLKLFFSTSFTTPVNEASLILTAPTCRPSATAIAAACGSDATFDSDTGRLSDTITWYAFGAQKSAML
ncbi:MAG: hypothetical protein VW519_10065 [Luminiphilus sp.]